MGGNTQGLVAAQPQLVLLYEFVCVLRARQRPQNTHKLILQLVVTAGDRLYEVIAPTDKEMRQKFCCLCPAELPDTGSKISS